MHTRRFLYVEYRRGWRELYDLRRDPWELRNVATDPFYAKTVASLHVLLHRLYATPMHRGDRGQQRRDRRLHPAHRVGGGRTLYVEVLRRLTDRGYRRVFAGITQPNKASNAFHRSFGFRDAGLYRRVEWKHGSWHDVAWMQLDLHGPADQDGPPGPIT